MDRFFSRLRPLGQRSLPTLLAPRLDRFLNELARLNQALSNNFDEARFIRFMNSIGPAVDKLRRHGHCINVWTASGLKRSELRNAAVLAWLFDPRQMHGRGAPIVSRLLSKLAEHYGPSFPVPMAISESYSVTTEVYPLGSLESRVDIIIENTDLVAFIEVKIDAPEGQDQINRYLELARARAMLHHLKRSYCVIYLSRAATEHPHANFVSATWHDVAAAIDEVAQSSTDFSDEILRQFSRHIRSF